MMIAFIAECPLAELNGFLGAPLEASQALLAMMIPDGFVIGVHFDIPAGADALTDPAGIAFFIRPETLIHAGNTGENHSVKIRKEHILP